MAIWNTSLGAGTDQHLKDEVFSLQYFSPLLIRPANLVFYAPLIGSEDIDYISGIALTENGTLSVDPHTPIRRPRFR